MIVIHDWMKKLVISEILMQVVRAWISVSTFSNFFKINSIKREMLNAEHFFKYRNIYILFFWRLLMRPIKQYIYNTKILKLLQTSYYYSIFIIRLYNIFIDKMIFKYPYLAYNCDHYEGKTPRPAFTSFEFYFATAQNPYTWLN